uniref:Uncharacterized protein n=1 Tax=Rhizophora mucronata TaxID=61149 RepID=A0A2P2NZV8_RHIMU
MLDLTNCTFLCFSLVWFVLLDLKSRGVRSFCHLS